MIKYKIFVIVQLTSGVKSSLCLAHQVNSLTLYSACIFTFLELILSDLILLGVVETGGAVCGRECSGLWWEDGVRN